MFAVHLLEKPGTDALSTLQQALQPGITVTTGPTPAANPPFHVLVAGRPEEADLEASQALQHVIVPWAGVPEATLHRVRARPGITLHNLHYNASAVSEVAMALLLAAAKRLLPMDRALRGGDWRPRYDAADQALSLQGRRALVLGLGQIGQLVARACQGLGMEVQAIKRRPDRAPGAFSFPVHPPEALATLLSETYALMICLPLTQATRGLIDGTLLARMPAGAVLVNVGRGPIVDEGALYHALSSGNLGGAGLDVWYNYPINEADRAETAPASYPFGELDNVVLSPHRAGSADNAEARRMAALATLLNAAASGQAVPNEVDLELGY